MMFDVKDKVALVTGGASGIGLCVVKELLRNGVKGVAIADINEKNGNEAILALEEEFGNGKAIFVKTDVSQKAEFEAAFAQTFRKFHHIDILVNNGGIYNDYNWEKEVDTNVKGVINGIILGLENYLKQHKQGTEAVIINTSSINAFRPTHWMPIYAATKSAIASLTTSWGCETHYERTKVRVVAICPGATETSLFDYGNCALKSEYIADLLKKHQDPHNKKRSSPDYVAKEAIKIIKYAQNGSLWIVENGETAYQYTYADRESFKDNVLQEQ